MIHSGSRNLGKQVADHYNQKAIQLNEKYFSSIPKKWDLAFIPLDERICQDYLLEMEFCVSFAAASRSLMMERVLESIAEVLNDLKFKDPIDIAHNYARVEEHFDEWVIVHRKGATSAKKGEWGIIPGSQGTASYIVRGRGNPDSFCSCSHGAGRKMGRNEASRTLNLEQEIKRLDDKGILHNIKTKKDLDEAAGAYKNIDTVMEEQTDLVEIVEKLEPFAVIKG